MAYSFNGSNQYISASTTPVTAAPFTISCWAYPTTTAVSFGCVGVTTSAGAASFRTQLMQASIGQNGRIGSFVQSVGSNANSTTTWSVNSWNHLVGLYTSSTSRTVYLNGGGAATNTASSSPNGVDSVLIGVLLNNSALFNYATGYICEVAIWNKALSVSEITALSKNISPSLISPQNLVLYSPLIRNLSDLSRNRTLTNNNQTTIAPHPRIYA